MLFKEKVMTFAIIVSVAMSMLLGILVFAYHNNDASKGSRFTGEDMLFFLQNQQCNHSKDQVIKYYENLDLPLDTPYRKYLLDIAQ